MIVVGSFSIFFQDKNLAKFKKANLSEYSFEIMEVIFKGFKKQPICDKLLLRILRLQDFFNLVLVLSCFDNIFYKTLAVKWRF